MQSLVSSYVTSIGTDLTEDAYKALFDDSNVAEETGELVAQCEL